MSSKNYEIPNPFAIPRQPYFLPGYTGFCPRRPWILGKTYGRTTHKVMMEQQELGQAKKFPPTSWKERRQTKAEVVEEKAKEGPCAGSVLSPVMYHDDFDINRRKRDVDVAFRIKEPYIGARLNPIMWRDPDQEAKQQLIKKMNEILDEKADKDRENELYVRHYPNAPPGKGVYSGYIPENIRKTRHLPKFEKMQRKTLADANLEVLYGNELTYNTTRRANYGFADSRLDVLYGTESAYNTAQRTKYGFSMEPKELRGVDPGTASYHPRARVEVYDIKSYRTAVHRPMPQH